MWWVVTLLRWTDGTVDAYGPAHRTNLALTGAGVAVLLAAGGILGLLDRRRATRLPDDTPRR